MDKVINIDDFKRARQVEESSWTIRVPYFRYKLLSKQVELLRQRAEEANARLIKELKKVR